MAARKKCIDPTRASDAQVIVRASKKTYTNAQHHDFTSVLQNSTIIFLFSVFFFGEARGCLATFSDGIVDSSRVFLFRFLFLFLVIIV